MNFIITESYTGYVEYYVSADTEEEAMKLYENGEYREIDTSEHERYNYEFYSIEEE